MINWIAKHYRVGELWRVVVEYADHDTCIYESVSSHDLESMGDDMIATLPDDLIWRDYCDDTTDAFTFVYINPTYYRERFGF